MVTPGNNPGKGAPQTPQSATPSPAQGVDPHFDLDRLRALTSGITKADLTPGERRLPTNLLPLKLLGEHEIPRGQKVLEFRAQVTKGETTYSPLDGGAPFTRDELEVVRMAHQFMLRREDSEVSSKLAGYYGAITHRQGGSSGYYPAPPTRLPSDGRFGITWAETLNPEIDTVGGLRLGVYRHSSSAQPPRGK